MGKGGAKKGKKGKKEKADAPEQKKSALSMHRDFALADLQPRFVTLAFNLMNWEYVNEELVFKVETPIFIVKDKLRELHGRIRNLRVHKAVFDQSTILGDDYIELSDEEFKLRTSSMTQEAIAAFRAEEQAKKVEAMNKDMQTLEDCGPLSFKGLVEGREAAEEGDAGYEAWLRDTGAVEGARGTVRQREDGTYEAVYKIWYDFKPENHDDPLMLSLSVGEGE